MCVRIDSRAGVSTIRRSASLEWPIAGRVAGAVRTGVAVTGPVFGCLLRRQGACQRRPAGVDVRAILIRPLGDVGLRGVRDAHEQISSAEQRIDRRPVQRDAALLGGDKTVLHCMRDGNAGGRTDCANDGVSTAPSLCGRCSHSNQDRQYQRGGRSQEHLRRGRHAG